MIYLIAAAFVLTAFGLYRRAREDGLRSVLLDTIVAAALGWLAGLFIGIGARIGMWSIPFFNGVDSRITVDGTVQVILIFSLFGIGLGTIYEVLFRRLLRNRGLIYGIIISIVSAYPLAEAGLQQISFDPPVLPTIAFSLLLVGLMFIPFAVILERLLGLYHRIRGERRSFNRMTT